jgi:hypothetical protein
MRQSAWLKRLAPMLRAKPSLGQAIVFVPSRFGKPNTPGEKKRWEADGYRTLGSHLSRKIESKTRFAHVSKTLPMLDPKSLIRHLSCYGAACGLVAKNRKRT